MDAAVRLPNGNILVPQRVEGEGIIGDTVVEISPEHLDFKRWDLYLSRIATDTPEGPQDVGAWIMRRR